MACSRPGAKARLQPFHQLPHGLRCQGGGRASPHGQLLQRTTGIQVAHHPIGLVQERLDVLLAPRLLVAQQGIAAAIATPTLAKGEMDVERQPGPLLIRFRKPPQHSGKVELGLKLRGRRIAGVAGTAGLIPVQQFPRQRTGRDATHRSNLHSLTERTKASIPARGVVGVRPWPRLAIWPLPPVASSISKTNSRISSGRPKRASGSTLP